MDVAAHNLRRHADAIGALITILGRDPAGIIVAVLYRLELRKAMRAAWREKIFEITPGKSRLGKSWLDPRQ